METNGRDNGKLLAGAAAATAALVGIAALAIVRVLSRVQPHFRFNTMFGHACVFNVEDSAGRAVRMLAVDRSVQSGAYLGEHRFALPFEYYRAIERRLRDPITGLYRHKWHEGKQIFTRGLYWGVGNGWALVGLMRMARAMLDRDDPRSDAVSADFRALVDAMIPYQAENGLFHDVLDDVKTFYESETAEMFAYSIYNMVSWRKLDDRYLEYADLARRAVTERVDADGIIRGCSGSPTFEQEGTSVEGQAHFIMMEAAAQRLGR